MLYSSTVKLPKVPGIGMIKHLPNDQKFAMLVNVISYMHETPSAMRKEFYLVKTLSCEKQNIANSISTGAQSQGAILRISNIRFFLKQA